MKHEFSRDFVGTIVGDWRCGRYDRATCRDMRHAHRWRARDRETAFQARDARTIDAVEGGPTPWWCGGEPLLIDVATVAEFLGCRALTL